MLLINILFVFEYKLRNKSLQAHREGEIRVNQIPAYLEQLKHQHNTRKKALIVSILRLFSPLQEHGRHRTEMVLLNSNRIKWLRIWPLLSPAFPGTSKYSTNRLRYSTSDSGSDRCRIPEWGASQGRIRPGGNHSWTHYRTYPRPRPFWNSKSTWTLDTGHHCFFPTNIKMKRRRPEVRGFLLKLNNDHHVFRVLYCSRIV